MRILLIAPHPFYQDRGTPIAVDMLLRVISRRGFKTDVLTFPEGEDRKHDGVTITRVSGTGKPRNIGPGFSFKKLYLDLFVFFRGRQMLKAGTYDLVHAVEEAAFMALIYKKLYGVPYIYDMDSSMSDQLLSKIRFLSPFASLFRKLEAVAIRNAIAVVPMCEDLAVRARREKADDDVIVVKDVSLITDDAGDSSAENIRESLGIEDTLVMYVGNLESYQGIDLLLQSFRQVRQHRNDVSLVIVGGAKAHIERYASLVAELDLGECVYLVGPRPVEHIGDYLRQADILVSPRSEGSNTPMKIYSYLHAGVPVVATNLPTHTQVLNDQNAVLVEPSADAFASGIEKLVENREYAIRLGSFARSYAEREHGFDSFSRSAEQLYSHVSTKMGA